MPRLLALLSVLLVATGSSSQELGESRPQTHEVSMEELLANPTFFDGQPVRVVGVADLGVGFEEFPKLYFSREAFENRTYQYFDVQFTDAWIENYAEPLAKLRGKYVAVEGVFGYEPRDKLDASAQSPSTICIPDCGTSGWLYDINLVYLRERIGG